MRSTLQLPESADFFLGTLRDRYGIDAVEPPAEQLQLLISSLAKLPHDLVLDSGVTSIGFRDMGPSQEYYPNHGLYVQRTLYLNSTLKDDDQVFLDSQGRALDRFDHTLFHELGHGWDERHGLLSERPQWLSLSGWSKSPAPGLCRVTIKESGGFTKEGEWFFSPSAQFPRFYAKTNPWDDWADCFAFYSAGLKEFLPTEKTRYFDSTIGRYWGL